MNTKQYNPKSLASISISSLDFGSIHALLLSCSFASHVKLLLLHFHAKHVLSETKHGIYSSELNENIDFFHPLNKQYLMKDPGNIQHICNHRCYDEFLGMVLPLKKNIGAIDFNFYLFLVKGFYMNTRPFNFFNPILLEIRKYLVSAVLNQDLEPPDSYFPKIELYVDFTKTEDYKHWTKLSQLLN